MAVTDLRFRWSDVGEPIVDLSRVTVNSGERLFVGGPSGCGKRLLALLGKVNGVVQWQHSLRRGVTDS